MARIDVKKYLFLGLERDKRAFFESAQDSGSIHFIENETYKPQKTLPPELEEVFRSLQILKGLEPIAQRHKVDRTELQAAAKEIVELKEQILELDDEEKMLRLEIERVKVFGSFSKEDVNALESDIGYLFRFFAAKSDSNRALPEGMIKVGEDHGLSYFLFIAKDEKPPHGFIEMKVDKPYQVLKSEYQKTYTNRETKEERLRAMAAYSEAMHHFFLEGLEKFDLKMAESFTKEELNGSVFAIEGWVPVSKESELPKLASTFHVHISEIVTEEKDRVPTYLENEGASRLGEDLVHIYDTPSITDKDPSIWVLWSFAIFFAFIIGDAGYGLVFLATALYIRQKYHPQKGPKKRFLNLFVILAGVTVLWGTMTTSFFGMSFPYESSWRSLSPMRYLVEKKASYHFNKKDSTYEYWVQKAPQIKDAKNGHEMLSLAETDEGNAIYGKFQDNILMEMALFIGIVHIILSLFRYSGRNWMAFGWMAVLVGGFFYFPNYLDADTFMNYVFSQDSSKLATQGLWLMGAGFTFSVALGIIKYKWLGIFEAMTVVQLLADVLSYLRLYALGLAGSIFSATINELAASTGLVFGFFIVIFGHTMNIVLGIMGGVIHGLRLNFLEWYHYSFEGGGKQFRPLKKIEHD